MQGIEYFHFFEIPRFFWAIQNNYRKEIRNDYNQSLSWIGRFAGRAKDKKGLVFACRRKFYGLEVSADFFGCQDAVIKSYLVEPSLQVGKVVVATP